MKAAIAAFASIVLSTAVSAQFGSAGFGAPVGPPVPEMPVQIPDIEVHAPGVDVPLPNAGPQAGDAPAKHEAPLPESGVPTPEPSSAPDDVAEPLKKVPEIKDSSTTVEPAPTVSRFQIVM